jgi:hypothetical protein
VCFTKGKSDFVPTLFRSRVSTLHQTVQSYYQTFMYRTKSNQSKLWMKLIHRSKTCNENSNNKHNIRGQPATAWLCMRSTFCFPQARPW